MWVARPGVRDVIVERYGYRDSVVDVTFPIAIQIDDGCQTRVRWPKETLTLRTRVTPCGCSVDGFFRP